MLLLLLLPHLLLLLLRYKHCWLHHAYNCLHRLLLPLLL
jgi:hypothetical protein